MTHEKRELTDAIVDGVVDAVSKALRRAYSLGQTYWQQADSESYSQNKKSDETRAKFDALVDDTRAMLAAIAAHEVLNAGVKRLKALAELRAKVEAIPTTDHNGDRVDLWSFRRDVLEEIDKMGGGV